MQKENDMKLRLFKTQAIQRRQKMLLWLVSSKRGKLATFGDQQNDPARH